MSWTHVDVSIPVAEVLERELPKNAQEYVAVLQCWDALVGINIAATLAIKLGWDQTLTFRRPQVPWLGQGRGTWKSKLIKNEITLWIEKLESNQPTNLPQPWVWQTFVNLEPASHWYVGLVKDTGGFIVAFGLDYQDCIRPGLLHISLLIFSWSSLYIIFINSTKACMK